MQGFRVALAAGAAMACTATPAFGQTALADGPGKEAVAGACASCHAVNLITSSSGYTRAHWEELIGTMIDLSATPERKDEIVGYLAKHYPPSGNRAAKLVPGPLKVSFKEWVVPTLGQRSRDPVEAPDGSIWWVGQMGNVIGRIDPATGAMKEWSLPPRALPHSVNVDAQGGVWYMGNGNGTIGKLDPATGEITEFKMPDPAARDPHTAEFDRNGVLWFTLQQSNMIGRFDPKTGDIKLVASPVARSRPYGVKIDAQGAPWVACNGAACLLKVDPATMKVSEVKLPTPGTTVRRLDIAEDGVIWYVNSGQGKLGRYDPKSGAIREWDSPSGPRSHPYAIAVVDGKVWYNESGVRPDPLVRFDPETETFQSWAVPSGSLHAGIIRHMRPTRDGDLLIHQSSTNRIIRVDLPKG